MQCAIKLNHLNILILLRMRATTAILDSALDPAQLRSCKSFLISSSSSLLMVDERPALAGAFPFMSCVLSSH